MSMPIQKPHRSRQNYQTPKELLTAVKLRLGIDHFSVDLAASSVNTVAPRFYSKRTNALVQPWALGGWNFLNPEFADITPWVKKAELEMMNGAHTVMLVPAGVGANWWRDFVHDKVRVLFLNGRLCFIAGWWKTIDPATLKAGKTPAFYATAPLYPKDCAVLLYSEKFTPGYEVWTWRKTGG